MSNQKFTDWRVMRKGGRIEINMGGSSIALADTPENLGIAVFIAVAPEMYDVLQHYFDLLEQANNGDAVAECKLFEDMALIEQVLMKARGEA